MVVLMTVQVHKCTGMRHCLDTILTAQKTCYLLDVMFHEYQILKVEKNYKSSARSSNISNQASYLFQKDISRKLLMAGVDCRRLLPFSERCGEADLLHCLTEERAAESSLGVGLGARLDGMLIPLTSDMKSSPRSPNSNHCKL